MSFSEELKRTRERSFYTQEAFAKELEVAFSTVNRWEGGKARPTRGWRMMPVEASDFLTKRESKLLLEAQFPFVNYSTKARLLSIKITD